MTSVPPATDRAVAPSRGGTARGAPRHTAVLVLLVTCAAIATWVIAYRHAPSALVVVDAHDYAQMGRQLARGEGFTSQQSFPFLLGWLAERGLATEPPWPNLTRFPLPILAIAGSMVAVGPGHLGAVLPGCVYLAATAALVFLLGNRLFGPWAGVAAAGAAFLTPGQIEYSVYGLTQTGASFFLVAAALALLAVQAGQPRRPGPALLLGALLGLAALQRTNLVLLVPAAVLALARSPGRRRLVAVAALGAGFALSVAPWAVRNAALGGTPTLSLDPAPSRMFLLGLEPGDPFASFEQRDAAPVVLAHLPALAAKLAVLLDPRAWPRIFGGEIAALLPLAAVAGFLLRGSPAATLAWFTLSAFAMNAALFAATLPGPKYSQPFQPLLWTLVVGGVATAARRRPQLPRWLGPATVAAGLAAAAAVSASLLVPRMARLEHHQSDMVAAFERLAERIPPGTLVASSMSWRVAWNTDRPSVRFDGDAVKLAGIDALAPVGAVLLDERRAARFRRELAQSPLAGEFGEVRFVPAAGLWLRLSGERAP